jgi:Predicted RNA-binding protein
MNTFDDNAQTYLEKILAILDIEATVIQEELDDTTTCYRIDCKADDARMLIGRNGQTLAALQFVVRQMCKTQMIEQAPFVVDVLDYRSRRKRTLEENAKRGAVAVLNGDSERFELEPMNPYERRLVHNYLQDNFPELSSDSEGQGEERHIVISYQGLPEDSEEPRKKSSSSHDAEEFEGDFGDDEDDEEYDDEEAHSEEKAGAKES